MMVEMLIQMPDLRRRIQSDHVADATGHCRDCPGTRWPCTLHQMATEADRRCVSRSRPAVPQQVGPFEPHPAAPMRPALRPPPPPRVPTQGVPAQLPAQRLPAYEPAMPGSGPVVLPGSGPVMRQGHSAAYRHPVQHLDDGLPMPRTGSETRPQHLIGVPRQPSLAELPPPKRELIDVLEDVLRWSR